MAPKKGQQGVLETQSDKALMLNVYELGICFLALKCANNGATLSM